ncbi:MAG: hypothetical protein JJ938_11595 [Roseicyclus sp.]|nr:hypothetical protein [Roseicyclus sp.]MBO6625518.1 hypothetical protein [Roseicyclus sp.]MBO6921430.1 hypothetical protein [Roseicyclus sp.]
MTPRVIRETSHLPAPPDLVWDLLQRPDTLIRITEGWLSFRPLDLPDWPETWQEGAYRVALSGPFGIPLGLQILRVSFPPPKGDTRFIRDRGEGQMVRLWDHLISLRPEGSGTRYADEVAVEAGWRTPFVAAFARAFYRRRQRRLKALVGRSYRKNQ